MTIGVMRRRKIKYNLEGGGCILSIYLSTSERKLVIA
jgi:hypothetical protein